MRERFHINSFLPSVLENIKRLNTPVQFVKGVGPQISKKFEKKGLFTVEDLIYFVPRGYEDRRCIKKIADAKIGHLETVVGEIILLGKSNLGRSKKRIFEIIVNDGSGIIVAKWFNFNERNLKDRFRKGQRVIMSGKVREFKYQKEIHHPDMSVVDESVDDIPKGFGGIIPIYSEIEGVSQKVVRRIVQEAVNTYKDFLYTGVTPDICERRSFGSMQEAVTMIHLPEGDIDIEALNEKRSIAHKRLIFEELFYFELAIVLKKRKNTLEESIPLKIQVELLRKFKEILPFELTLAQKRVVREIIDDLRKPHPMNRLLQGDVGSGKTIVGIIASLIAVGSSTQVAIMAPTEILAEQHYLTIRSYLQPLSIPIAILTSSVKRDEKKAIYKDIKAGTVSVVVGTHAIIEEELEFSRLGLVIIDEQHRFGVLQRAALKKKGTPHVLVMTATPIPRTLSMTVYGDLDVSVIDKLPDGRKPILTKLFNEKSREWVYEIMRREVREGRQAYVVYPIIEESEKVDLLDATKMAEHLQSVVFPEYTTALVHGKMKRDERESIMKKFKDGEIDILVSTTVIE
ncbi:MAG: ATP-dependent DNA helicase RecG, partial [Thermodesulfobacteriota bacterium]|nr:ATP-dependent DNA helicase RecG [Thermodesulfobacteriota bacterium]